MGQFEKWSTDSEEKNMIQTITAAIVLAGLLHYEAPRPQSRGTAQPQGGQRGTASRTPGPLTLRQVIESLSSFRNSRRVEDLISRRGVQFQASPAILEILTEFGADPKLLSLIPPPPPPPLPPAPPTPPAPKMAGALTVVCEPRDCSVVVDNMYKGVTAENRKLVTGLHAGDATVEVFADGYEGATRRVRLEEGKPLEEKFSLRQTNLLRQQRANGSLL